MCPSGRRQELWLRGVVILLPLILCSCDTFFRIQGEIAVKDQKAPKCELLVHDAADGRIKDRARISAAFSETFPASWFPKEYYVVVTCEGIKDQYHSKTFKVKYGEHFEPPIMLGRIELNK